MKLNYKVLGEGKPLVILHGLFGTLDNWMTAGKYLSTQGYQVYLVDQRNHGKSPHDEVFNYEAMAQDLSDFLDDHKLKKATLIGHSMGGKTIMQFLLTHSFDPEKVVIVDIGPKGYPPHHQEILAGFDSVPLDKISKRSEADEILSKTISDFGVRQFLLKNLDRVEGSYQWKMNYPVIKKNIENIGADMMKLGTYELPVLFIKGELSNYILDKDIDNIKKVFPKATFSTVSKSGHWVHAENPVEFGQKLMSYLND